MASNPPLVSNFLDTATDGQLRSRHLQQLLQETVQGHVYESEQPIPRTLVQYWDESEIPPDVQRCLDTWRVLEHQSFDRIIFNRDSARTFIKNHFNDLHLTAFDSCVHPAMRSDYFRLCFLSRHGGLYVDADDELRNPNAILPLVDTGMLQLQPLCYRSSTDSMVVPSEYAHEVNDDLTFYAANDPIFAPANHTVICAALSQATERLIAAGGLSRDIQWLTGPGNLSEVLVHHSLRLEKNGAQPDFGFISSWVQIAPGDWTLEYRNDDRNWRLWVAGAAE